MSIKERRARDKANLREEILDAARTLFVREGYDNVSIRQIAKKVEYAPGTIYLYFKDKLDIFATLCDETFGKLHARLSAIEADNAPPLEKLRRAGYSYIHFALENPAHYTLIFLKPISMSSTEAMEAHSSGRLCFEHLCHIVRQCMEQGLLNRDDPNEVSQTVWAAVHGIASLLITCAGFPFVERNRLIDSLIDMILRGIAKQPSG